MTEGRFGPFGGQYIPETLMNEIHRLEKAYDFYKHDAAFQAELKDLLDNYANRPSLLYYAKKMTEDLGGAKIYLKREDLNHTGAHKINNALWGSACWLKRWARPVSLQKPVQGSMGWLPLRQRRSWDWNVKYSWERKILRDRH